MAYLTDDDVEKLAQSLRMALGVDDQLRPDMVDVVEKLKFLGYIADYVRVPDRQMLDAEARFNPHERKLYLRESTYEHAARGQPRSRWTIAHEIGHLALNHQQTRNRSSSNVEIERVIPNIQRDETQAHKFAAAFLAPFHLSEFSLKTTAAH